MDEIITKWFADGCNYNKGLEIYRSCSTMQAKTLQLLERGPGGSNLNLLITELSKAKKDPRSKQLAQITVKPNPPKPINIETMEDPQARIKKKTVKTQLDPIRYADLPGELKIRYKQLKDLFYEMCDLKFLLNDLPKNATKKALDLQLQIEDLDDNKSKIWKELEHWQQHKTLLPNQANDFTDLSIKDLYRKKANLSSNICKLQKRIDKYREEIAEGLDRKKNDKTNLKMKKSIKTLHQHELDLNKVKELIK